MHFFTFKIPQKSITHKPVLLQKRVKLQKLKNSEKYYFLNRKIVDNPRRLNKTGLSLKAFIASSFLRQCFLERLSRRDL